MYWCTKCNCNNNGEKKRWHIYCATFINPTPHEAEYFSSFFPFFLFFSLWWCAVCVSFDFLQRMHYTRVIYLNNISRLFRIYIISTYIPPQNIFRMLDLSTSYYIHTFALRFFIFFLLLGLLIYFVSFFSLSPRQHVSGYT